MLVLSRKPGEKIIINNGQITVTIVAVKGQRVRVGIVAPPNIVVDREEIADVRKVPPDVRMIK